MKILLAGGGSGGHITPLLAVADALRKNKHVKHVYHIGQKGEQLDDVMKHHHIDQSVGIQAGKFRRYHGESKIKQLLDVKTMALNVRDLFRFIAGTWQAYRVLGRLKPDAVFLKGGFVCVPVGFAARLRKIPYITHDSDAIPGLANRITAKHAVYNAVAMPTAGYPYPSHKAMQTGIPLRPEYKPVTAKDHLAAKKKLHIPKTSSYILVSGGGLGARNLNESVLSVLPDVHAQHPTIRVTILTGRGLYDETVQAVAKLPSALQKQIDLVDFTTEMHVYTAAADVVIARAGATSMAELALQKKPSIFVPNPVLTGGQQLHNAKLVIDNNAGVVTDEGDHDSLRAAVLSMLVLPATERAAYGDALHSILSHDNAADELARLLVSIVDMKPHTEYDRG